MQWLAVHVDPFERYMTRRSPQRGKGHRRRGRVSYPASTLLALERADLDPSQTAALTLPGDVDHAEEIESDFFRAYRSILERHSDLLASIADALINEGRTTVSTDRGAMDARLIRFWNGSAAIDLRMESGSSIARIGRKVSRNQIAGILVDCLAMSLANSQARPVVD